jgi:hypothetical protein
MSLPEPAVGSIGGIVPDNQCWFILIVFQIFLEPFILERFQHVTFMRLVVKAYKVGTDCNQMEAFCVV